ncbi:MAG: hypothetical protein HN981_05000 [Candidatus Pacebacteria bacterium]|jgi:hypothetical protein|nr:hypothetical protein [Candidatus Paceibacterota bacterium]MBT4652346.1 hypothetical protein [Candidatus Paceibacterota bacterium]MBT6756173.1 hypothetical protein [Candidatus Paceibacterota bacterium]MBT6921722.1 hypothetical protein [Candidatus Paceibacterota bacterium]
MLNREKIIAFDADGVLVNSQVPIIKAVNERFDTSFVLEDWISFTSLFEEVLKLTGDDAQTVAAWMFSTPIMIAAEPFQDSVETSRKLADHGYQQLVFTSRPPHQEEPTKNWFAENYPWIGRDDVHLRPADSGMNGDEFKQHKIERLRPLSFIDDNAETIKFLLEQGLVNPNLLMTLLLRDRYWNEYATDLDGIRANQMGRLLEELGLE